MRRFTRRFLGAAVVAALFAGSVSRAENPQGKVRAGPEMYRFVNLGTYDSEENLDLGAFAGGKTDVGGTCALFAYRHMF
jgi:hypothetical protein